jgi:hypothetical protein
MLAFLDRPIVFTTYVRLYVGAAVSGENYQASLHAGTAILLVFAACSAWALRNRRTCPNLIPFVILGLSAVGCAVTTAVGRMGFGEWSAMAPRYATFPALLWIACSTLLLALAERAPAGVTLSPVLRAVMRAAAAAAILTALAVHAFRQAEGSERGVEHGRTLAEARSALLEGRPLDPALRRKLAPEWVDLERMRAMLERNRLSLFRRP